MRNIYVVSGACVALAGAVAVENGNVVASVLCIGIAFILLFKSGVADADDKHGKSRL